MQFNDRFNLVSNRYMYMTSPTLHYDCPSSESVIQCSAVAM